MHSDYIQLLQSAEQQLFRCYCDIANAFVESNKLFEMFPMFNAVAKLLRCCRCLWLASLGMFSMLNICCKIIVMLLVLLLSLINYFECCQCLMLLQNKCDVFIVTATLLSKHRHACQSYCGCAVVFQNNNEIDKKDLNSLHRLMGSQIMLSVG